MEVKMLLTSVNFTTWTWSVELCSTVCKEYISYYRKLATKIVYLQPEQQHEHWEQAWDKPHQQQVQWHEHRHAQVAHVSMHWERVVFVFRLMMCHMHLMAQDVLESHLIHVHSHTWAFLLDFTFLPSCFDLSFTVLFHFSFRMHLDQYTELDNLITMQDLRTSANKGSNDAYDVHTSLTQFNQRCGDGSAIETDQTGQFLDMQSDSRHAPLIIDETGCNANTKTVSTPQNTKTSRCETEERVRFWTEMQHNTDPRAWGILAWLKTDEILQKHDNFWPREWASCENSTLFHWRVQHGIDLRNPKL